MELMSASKVPGNTPGYPTELAGGPDACVQARADSHAQYECSRSSDAQCSSSWSVRHPRGGAAVKGLVCGSGCLASDPAAEAGGPAGHSGGGKRLHSREGGPVLKKARPDSHLVVVAAEESKDISVGDNLVEHTGPVERSDERCGEDDRVTSKPSGKTAPADITGLPMDELLSLPLDAFQKVGDDISDLYSDQMHLPFDDDEPLVSLSGTADTSEGKDSMPSSARDRGQVASAVNPLSNSAGPRVTEVPLHSEDISGIALKSSESLDGPSSNVAYSALGGSTVSLGSRTPSTRVLEQTVASEVPSHRRESAGAQRRFDATLHARDDSNDFRPALVEPMIYLLIDMLSQSGSPSVVANVVQSGDLPIEVWRRKEALDLLEGHVEEEEWAAVFSNMINASERLARTTAQKLLANFRKLAEPHCFANVGVQDLSPLFRAITQPKVLKSLVSAIRNARVKGSSKFVLAYANDTLQILDAVRALSQKAIPSKKLYEWCADESDPERQEKLGETLEILKRLVLCDAKSATPKYIEDALPVVSKIIGKNLSRNDKPKSPKMGSSSKSVVFHDSRAHMSVSKKDLGPKDSLDLDGFGSAAGVVNGVAPRAPARAQRPAPVRPLSSLLPKSSRADGLMVPSAATGIAVTPIPYEELVKKSYEAPSTEITLQSKLRNVSTAPSVKKSKLVTFADMPAGRGAVMSNVSQPNKVVTIESVDESQTFDAGDPLDMSKPAVFREAVSHRMQLASRRNVIILMQGVMRNIRERVSEQVRATGTENVPKSDSGYCVRDWRIPRA